MSGSALRLPARLPACLSLSDLLQVLADLRESKGLLGHAATLALAGLVSGGLSAYKNWQKAAVKP
jgi:hypothetical protein